MSNEWNTRYPGVFDCLAALIRVVDQRAGGVEADIFFFPAAYRELATGTKNNVLLEQHHER